MIRILKETDRQDLLNFLYKEPSYNIFPIGDIETFGFDTDFQRIYAEIEEGEYKSIFLRYRENAVYYASEEKFNKEYLEIFKSDPFDYISGKSNLMKLIDPYLEDFEGHQTYFCELKRTPIIEEPRVNYKTMNSKTDAYKVYDFMHTVEEFSSYTKEREAYVESKMTSMDMGVTLYIEEDGKVVSSVATTAETKINGMVVAVATDKDYRNKGYASALMEVLIYEYLVKKNKELCLFYDNVNAGKIYHRLGFETIGTWDMYKRVK